MTWDADDYFVCPNCGSDVAADESFCRACGASEESGWNEEYSDVHYETEDDFVYEEFIEREFPKHAALSPAQRLRTAFFAIVVLLVCLALVIGIIL